MSAGPSRFRWFVVSLLFIATTINYIDRQILALLKPILDQELGWTNEEFGWVNSAFFGVYAASYVVFGWFIDRVGVKRGFTVSIVWWSLAAIAHALVGSVRGFFCARVALGAGEGGNFPACIKAVAIWFPKRERALASSLFTAGASVGPILAPALVPWIALNFGWRAAFVLAGAAGFLWLALWLPFFKNTPRESPLVSPGERELIESDRDPRSDSDRPVGWPGLFALRQTWSIVLAKFLTDPIAWFFLIWLPDFFKKTRGMDIKGSWLHLVTIYSIAAAFSVAGGWLSGHLIGRGWSITKGRKTVMLICSLAVTPVLLVSQVGDWTAVVIIGFALAAHHAWSSTIYASTSDMFPKSAIAAVSGIAGMSGALGGMMFPVIAGKLLDHFKDTAAGESAGYAILFVVCGSAYVVALAISHCLAPRFEQIDFERRP